MGVDEHSFYRQINGKSLVGCLEGMHHAGKGQFVNMVGFQMGKLQRGMGAVPISHRKIFRQ